jgi:hypothetical protein
MTEHRTFYAIWFDRDNTARIESQRGKVTSKTVTFPRYHRAFHHKRYRLDALATYGIGESPGEAINRAIAIQQFKLHNLSARVHRYQRAIDSLKALRGTSTDHVLSSEENNASGA